MKILFLHGWRYVPGGIKPTFLREHGHEVIDPALDDDDFSVAIRTAQHAYDECQPDLVVGLFPFASRRIALELSDCGSKMMDHKIVEKLEGANRY